MFWLDMPLGLAIKPRRFSQISAALPQAGGMEVHAIPMQQRAEVDIDGCANTVPYLELRGRPLLEPHKESLMYWTSKLTPISLQPASHSSPISEEMTRGPAQARFMTIGAAESFLLGCLEHIGVTIANRPAQ